MRSAFKYLVGNDLYSTLADIELILLDTLVEEISDVYEKMLQNPEFCAILEELVDFGISRYKVNYSYHYQDTNLVLYQKYTYEDACRLLNWERNEVPLNIGGYKYDKKTKTFPIFIK